MKILIIISFVGFSLLLAPLRAEAQETQISVSPAIVDAPVNVGRSISKKILITNGSESALPISIDVQAAVIEAESLEGSEVERYDVADWVRFPEDTYLFEPRETKEISFTVTAPFNALSGGHYAQISIRGLSLQQESSGDANSLIFPEVGVPVLVTVPGEIVEDARLSDGASFPSLVSPDSSIDSRLYFENLGTIHNLVSSSIVVEKNGQVIQQVALPPTILLPQTRKAVSKIWQTKGYGKQQVYVQLSFGNRNQIYRSDNFTIYSAPPLADIIMTAIITWTTLYVVQRRSRLGAAWKMLIMKP